MLALPRVILRNARTVQMFFARTLSISMVHQGKMPDSFWVKKRKLNNNYGVLTDTPDWSFLDGRPAPPGARATQRKAIQRQICERIIQLNAEIEKSKKIVVRRRRSRIRHVSERNASRFEERDNS